MKCHSKSPLSQGGVNNTPRKDSMTNNFPPKEQLKTYGVDTPVPTSKDDLVCEYREDEDNPVILADLDGYKVPPEGLAFVAKSGSGYGPKLIYGNGTFRQNMYGIGAPLGTSSNDMQIARAKAKEDAITDGILEALEEHGIDVSTSGGMISNLKEVAKHVTTAILKEDTPAREKRMWFNDIKKIYDNQEDIIKERSDLQNKLNEMGMEAIDIILQETKRAKQSKLDIVDGEWEELEDGEDGISET